jgi:hypothetical protein
MVRLMGLTWPGSRRGVLRKSAKRRFRFLPRTGIFAHIRHFATVSRDDRAEAKDSPPAIAPVARNVLIRGAADLKSASASASSIRRGQEQHGQTTTWLANQPPDAGLPHSTEEVAGRVQTSTAQNLRRRLLAGGPRQRPLAAHGNMAA